MSQRVFLPYRFLLALSLGVASVAAPVVAPAAFAAGSPPAADAPLKLKKLVITGNKDVTTEEIMAALPFHQGDTVTQNQIAEGVQDVLGVYKKKNVGVSFGQKMKFIGNKDVEVQWLIGEQAAQAPQALVVDEVVFTGNKKVSTADLQAATALKAGSEVSNDTVSADQQAIQALYKKKNVSMSVGMTPTYPTPGHAVVTWIIVEK